MTREPNNNNEQVILPDIENFDSEINTNNPNYKAEVSGRENKTSQEQVDNALNQNETREGATEPDNGDSAGLKDDPPAIHSEHPERPPNPPKNPPGDNNPGGDKSVEPNEGEIPEKNDTQDNDGKNAINETPSSPTPSSPTPVDKNPDDSPLDKNPGDNPVDKNPGDNPEKPLSPLERFNKKSGNANQDNTGGNVNGKSPNMPPVPQVKNVNGNPISNALSASKDKINNSISNKALEDSLTGKVANRFKKSQDFMTKLPGRTGEENSMGTIARQIQSAQKNIQNIKKNFEKVNKGVKGVAKVLASPIFWIAVAIIIILVFIIVVPTFFGPNDNKAAACNDISVRSNLLNIKVDESGYASLSEDDKKNNAYIIMSWLMSNNFDLKGGEPLSKEEAAAIVGNMWKESQMNPAATQNNWAVENGYIKTEYRRDISLNSESGKGVGLIQWDGVRRANYSNSIDSPITTQPGIFSQTQAKWADPRNQLEFLQKELNEGGERYTRMAATTFFDNTTSLEEKTRIFNKDFEGSGDDESGINLRITYAKTVYEYVTDVSTVGANCDFGEIPTDLVELATSMAPDSSLEGRSARANAGVLTNGSYGATQAKALSEESDPYRFSTYYNAYIAADEIKKEPLARKTENFLYASCDRFVATAVILTVDEKFPWGGPFQQYHYMRDSINWLEVSSFSQLQAGDIMVTTSSATGMRHIVMYIGDYTDSNGKEYTNVVASASSLQRIGTLDSNYGGMKTYSDDAGHTAIDGLNRPYKIFRFKG